MCQCQKWIFLGTQNVNQCAVVCDGRLSDFGWSLIYVDLRGEGEIESEELSECECTNRIIEDRMSFFVLFHWIFFRFE